MFVLLMVENAFDLRQKLTSFPLTSGSRPLMGSPSLLHSWYSRGVLSPEVKRGRGVMLTTHPLLMPRLEKNRCYTSSPPKRHPSFLVASFYPYLYENLLIGSEVTGCGQGVRDSTCTSYCDAEVSNNTSKYSGMTK
jgi:hypothetical protein